MINILFVGLGGFFGCIARYLISKGMIALFPAFPFGTLISNVLAAFIIGFIIGYERNTEILSEKTRVCLTSGFLGGLSTFSTFSMETVLLFESKKYIEAGGNILLNVVLCLVFVVIGMFVASLVTSNGSARP